MVKGRHGLNRYRYKGDAGIKRWVGLSVIADNVRQHQSKQSV
jgi:IS5 family transposase